MENFWKKKPLRNGETTSFKCHLYIRHSFLAIIKFRRKINCKLRGNDTHHADNFTISFLKCKFMTLKSIWQSHCYLSLFGIKINDFAWGKTTGNIFSSLAKEKPPTELGKKKRFSSFSPRWKIRHLSIVNDAHSRAEVRCAQQIGLLSYLSVHS